MAIVVGQVEQGTARVTRLVPRQRRTERSAPQVVVRREGTMWVRGAGDSGALRSIVLIRPVRPLRRT